MIFISQDLTTMFYAYIGVSNITNILYLDILKKPSIVISPCKQTNCTIPVGTAVFLGLNRRVRNMKKAS